MDNTKTTYSHLPAIAFLSGVMLLAMLCVYGVSIH